MSIRLTDEQRAAIEDNLVSQAVVACAGSGKTFSAVHRLAEIRSKMKQTKGYVALLSYSNVAVDTFRAEYYKLVRNRPALSGRVVISTVDSFITSNILLPHGSDSMKCGSRPFLVHGGEQWLKGFMFFNGSYPVAIRDLNVTLENSSFMYSENSSYGGPKAVSPHVAIQVIDKLGRVGAYTHALARYWALRILIEQERRIDILARRYPFILVDEAQDIGSMHGAMVSLLREAGTMVSLIGDPNQAIYEFADADGSFLRSFGDSDGVVPWSLTENRRSVAQIVAVAGALALASHKAMREPPARKHGAFFFRYKPRKLEDLVDTFRAILRVHGYRESDAAILCRGAAMTEALSGGAVQLGTGATEWLAQAAIHRDRRGDIAKAFECLVHGVFRLLDGHEERMIAEIRGSSPSREAKTLRRIVWRFLKDRESGLPESTLRAKDQWHPRLKERLPKLFEQIESASLLKRSSTWGNNFTVKGLSERPLVRQDLVSTDGGAVRTRTVHKVKGESIDAVMYIAKKTDLDSLLAGTTTEEGRIGYVAVTRARDLFILAIPEATDGDVVETLVTKGFVEWI